MALIDTKIIIKKGEFENFFGVHWVGARVRRKRVYIFIIFNTIHQKKVFLYCCSIEDNLAD